jgi:hypothetical protein
MTHYYIKLPSCNIPFDFREVGVSIWCQQLYISISLSSINILNTSYIVSVSGDPSNPPLICAWDHPGLSPGQRKIESM